MAPRHAHFCVEMAHATQHSDPKTSTLANHIHAFAAGVAETVVRMDTLIHPAITFTLPD